MKIEKKLKKKVNFIMQCVCSVKLKKSKNNLKKFSYKSKSTFIKSYPCTNKPVFCEKC